MVLLETRACQAGYREGHNGKPAAAAHESTGAAAEEEQVTGTDSRHIDSERQHLWNRRCDILYRAELSTLYHRKRESFFALLDKWDKIFTLLFGSAVFVQLISLDKYPLLALPFAVLTFASLIFDFSENSRRHSELATNFKMLEAAIEATGDRDFDEMDLI